MQDTAELFFEDCRLPADALLGGEAGLNRGFYQLMQELPQERLLISNLCMAACEFMFEETRDYVKQRKAFGKTLSKLQTIQHKLAEIKTEVRFSHHFDTHFFVLYYFTEMNLWRVLLKVMYLNFLSMLVDHCFFTLFCHYEIY